MILDQGNGQKVSRISLNVLSSVLLTVAVLTSCTAKEEPDSLVVFAAASDVGLGKARVPLTIALIDGTRYDDQADSLVVTYTPPKSDESRLVEDLTWRPWPMRSGAYTATMNFDQVGFWTITVSSREEDAMKSANGAILVKSATDAPDIGDEAPRSVTKTVPSDGNLKSITSAPSPDPDLYSISFADAQVGRLLDALDKSPHAEDTIIVLWSDHGMHIGEKQQWEKFTLFEESTRVPLMIVAPGVTNGGGVCDRPVNLLDVYPTLNELCALPARKDLDGVSLVPLLKNPKAKWDRSAVTTWGRDNHAVRGQRYRYIRHPNGTEQLYDHKTDPDEFTNLAARPDLAAVKKRLGQWLPKTNAAPVRNKK